MEVLDIKQRNFFFTHILVGFVSALIPIIAFLLLPTHASAMIITRPGNNLGLIAWWTLDEGVGTVAHDFSGNRQVGQLVSSPTWISGHRGQGLSFNGSTQYIDTANFADNLSNFSVSTWFKALPAASQPNCGGQIVSKYSSGGAVSGNGWSVALGGSGCLSANVVYGQIQSGGGGSWFSQYTSSGNYNDGKWHHVVMIVTGGSTITLYVDGALATQNSSSGTMGSYSNTSNVRIGDDYNDEYFNGSVDDVRVYNRTISAGEVAALYQNNGVAKIVGTSVGIDGLSNGLVGWWTFDGKDMSPRIMDRSGYGNNASIYRYVDATGMIIPGSTTTTAGKFGQAFVFTSPSVVNDEVIALASTSPSLQFTGDFSVSVWIKTNTLNSNNQTVFIESSNFPDNGWDILDDGQFHPEILFRVMGGGHWYDADFSRDVVNDNKWHNIVGVHSGTSIYAYVDGVQQPSTNILVDGISQLAATHPVSYIPNTTTDVLVGDASNPNTVSYAIDDIRIYSRALSQSEITKLYQGNTVTKKNVSNNGLVGWWPFDEGAGTIAHDFSGHANTGTLISSPTWVSGKRGKALSFDGVNGSVRVSGPTIGSSHTVVMWIYPTAFPGTYNNLVGQDTNTAYQIHASTRLQSFGDSDYLTESNTPIKLNQWQQVGMVNNGGTVTYYYNGNPDGTPGASTASGYTVGYIAKNNGSEPFQGSIDDVRVYSRALSADEMRELYEGSN